jgi:hypothetical protein
MITYRISLVDSERHRALVVIYNTGSKVGEIKWIPLGALQLAQVIDFRQTKQEK